MVLVSRGFGSTVPVLLALLATSTEGQALVKQDVAMWGINGATLDDCFWSAGHERSLNGQYLREFAWHTKIPICVNVQIPNAACTPKVAGWQDAEQCIARIDLYYKAGYEPLLPRGFDGTKGFCTFQAYGNNAGGAIGGGACNCNDVGIKKTCWE